MESPTLLERREFKYLVTADRIPKIRAAIQGICVPDRYAGPDGRYPIRSLYLDTPDLQLYRNNVRELSDRFKVRVRCYPNASNAPIFLEVKRRTGDIIRKVRTPIPAATWPAVMTDLPGAHPPAVDAFRDLCSVHDLQPTTLVEYQREAWASELDDYGRITFDTAIGCMPADGWSLAATSSGCTPVDHPVRTATFAPVTIVEMKFAGPPPVWMIRLAQRLDLVRQAFSKYGTSIVEAGWPVGDHRPRAAWG